MNANTASPIHTAALLLAGMGRHRAPAIGGAVEAALNLALSLALVRPLGLIGVALGTAISGALTNAWVAPRAACAELGIGLAAYVRGALAPALPPALLAGGLALAAEGRVPALTLAAVIVIFAAIFWMTGLDAGERREALTLFRAAGR